MALLSVVACDNNNLSFGVVDDDGGASDTDAAACDDDACQACRRDDDSACETACAGCADAGADDTSSGNVPQKNCTMNALCGVPFECVTCGVMDRAGWCQRSIPCVGQGDCGESWECRYNVETDERRCLPKSHCE